MLALVRVATFDAAMRKDHVLADQGDGMARRALPVDRALG